MDQSHTRLCEKFDTIPLSPIHESSGSSENITDSHLSVFDPPEGNEEHPGQREMTFHNDGEPERSPDASCMQRSQRVTRSRSGAIPKQALKEVSPKKTKKKREMKVPVEMLTKETQVMPRMLPRGGHRASKSRSPADPEMKENMPPTIPKSQQASHLKVHEVAGDKAPKAPRKQQKPQEIHDVTAVKRRVLPELSPNTSLDFEHFSSSAPSTHETTQSSDHGSMYGIQSFAEYSKDELEGEENDHRPVAETEALPTNPSSGLTIKLPQNQNNEPMALLLHSELFKEGNTVGIKLSDGQVFVSSKREQAETSKKNLRKKRDEERKSKGPQRSCRDCWSSSESDYSDSSCSCSSCNATCSCCDSSSSSSSDRGHHNQRPCRRHR